MERRITRRRAVALVVIALLLAVVTYMSLAYQGLFGKLEMAGEVTEAVRPQQVIT